MWLGGRCTEDARGKRNSIIRIIFNCLAKLYVYFLHIKVIVQTKHACDEGRISTTADLAGLGEETRLKLFNCLTM